MSDILDEINALANERYRLYQAKWTKRNSLTYRETIKRMDRQIADLWQDRRVELAQGTRSARPVVGGDVFEVRGEVKAVSSFQVRDGDRWRNVDDETLTDGIRRYVAEIPADDPDIKIVPLKVILAKRGVKLEWQDIRGGGGFHKLVPLRT